MHKIKRFLVEREVLLGLVIFEVLVMFADFCSDMDWHFTAAMLRILGILALFTLLGLDLWFRFRRRPIDVPLMFTAEKDRSVARSEWGNPFRPARRKRERSEAMVGKFCCSGFVVSDGQLKNFLFGAGAQSSRKTAEHIS